MSFFKSKTDIYFLFSGILTFQRIFSFLLFSMPKNNKSNAEQLGNIWDNILKNFVYIRFIIIFYIINYKYFLIMLKVHSEDSKCK